MNLFITDPSPVLCAQALDDRRMIKAVLETAQLLATTLGVGYRPSHINHPVTKWVGLSRDNFIWTYQHWHALGDEYTFRFGKRHKSMELDAAIRDITSILSSTPPAAFQNSARNDRQQLDFTHLPVPESYREYLRAKWSLEGAKARWTRRAPPSWR